MRLTVYMAISIDGRITKGSTDSDWVSKTDWDQFYAFIKANDAVIMGRTTMDQFDEGNFPIEGTFNIVLTNNISLHKETKNYSIMTATPNQVLDYAKAKGFKNLLLIGGSKTNKHFIQAGLVDELVLSVHPIIIGNGLSVFGNEQLDIKLELLETKEINKELVQLRYKVVK